MLGELVEETRGKRIVRRILSTDPVNVEVTFEGGGKLLGVDVNELGTYTSQIRPDGLAYGEGQGVLISSSGEMVSWKGQGIGTLKPGGAVSYRGAIYYSTTSAKFARLNPVAGVFEYEVDAQGNTHGKVWEWK